MNSIIKSERKLNSFGFTLVELILSLSIFAVIMAIVIPSFLGFVEKAKEKQDLLDAKLVLETIQAELGELYATSSDSLGKEGEFEKYIMGKSNVNSKGVHNDAQKNGDVNATIPAYNKKPTVDYKEFFGTRVMETAGVIGDPNTVADDPCCIVFGVGSNWDNNKEKDKTGQTNLKDKYTVYYLFYMRTTDSTPFFWFNGEWTNTIPRTGKNDNRYLDGYNVIQTGPNAGKRIQYYCISNESGTSFGSTGFWNWAWKFK